MAKTKPPHSIIPAEKLEHHIILTYETNRTVERLLKEWSNKEKLASYGLRPTKSVLIEGISGNGKTLLAHHISKNLGLPLMDVLYCHILSNDPLVKLREVFEKANQQKCLVLFDDIEILASGTICNVFIQLLKEFESYNSIIVGTTSYINIVGDISRHFEQIISLTNPGELEIDKLLRTALSSFKIHSDTLLCPTISALIGKSAHQIVKCARDAAKAMVLDGDTMVKKHHLQDAIKKLPK